MRNVLAVSALLIVGSFVFADMQDDLLAAAKKGDVAAVKELLTKGADVNAKTAYGVTALLQAVGQGHDEVVKLLLERKADPNIKDTFYGQTPLTSAVGKNSVEMVTALLDAGAKDTDAALRQAAAAGRLELVRIIVEKAKPKEEALTKALAATPAKKTEVADLLTKAGGKPAAKTETKPGAKIDRAILEGYVGTYREPESFFDATVTLKDDSLTADFGGTAIVLSAENDTTFRLDGGITGTVTFQKEGDKVTGMALKTERSDLKFKRVEAGDVQPKAMTEQEPARKAQSPLNWPQFRGAFASGNGDGQFPPTTFDAEKNVNIRWKTPIPGLGHSCPVIWGNRVFITTAVSGDPKATLKPGQYGSVDSVEDDTEHQWHLYAVDKKSGSIVWDEIAYTGVPKVKRHLKGTHANCSPTTDGKHVVVCFGSEGMYCYDFDGKLLWKRDLGKLGSGWFFDADYEWGFGSSPILYRGMVIIQCDVGKGSFIAAFDVKDGREVWRTEREEIPSWGTPTIVEGPDRVELVTNATKFARGYDPMTGKELWRLGKHSEITVPTPLYGHGLIFITSGYRPIQPIYAIRPGATGDISLETDKSTNDSVAWSVAKNGPYMPTPIVYGEHLYTCANGGILACYDAKTGKQHYRERLGGKGGYTGSPVAADGRLYFPSEEGGVRVVKAGPIFELLAVNPLGDVCMTTPAISDGMIFIRTQKSLIAAGR